MLAMKPIFVLLLLFTLGCSEKQVYESSDTHTPTESSVSSDTLPEKNQAQAPASAYKNYAGVYKMQGASFDEVAISEENGKLFAQASGEQKVEIYPDTAHTFNVPAFNAKIVFAPDTGSTFSGITVWLEGNGLKGKKI